MFEGSLIESVPAGRHSTWTKGISFLVQTAALTAAVMASFVYTDALPNYVRAVVLDMPPPTSAPAPAQPPATSQIQSRSELENGRVLIPPRTIPRLVAIINDEVAGPPRSAGIPGALPGTAENAPNPMLSELMRSTPNTAVSPTTPRRLRVSSGIVAGLLVHQVRPQYPPLARIARIEGVVVLQAIIGKDGTVQNVQLVRGHPLLVEAAIEAVRQWRYRPYLLNSEPVDVDTTIQVNFTLGGQ